jgi:CRISPR/Cas system-associated exonuclease Cas4 (RecB family)
MKNLVHLMAVPPTKPVRDITPIPSIDMEEELVKSLDACIADKYIVERTRKIGGFHPSTTNECGRYAIYLFRGVTYQPKYDARTQRIFDNGHATHDRIYGYLRDMGILIADEVPVTYDDPPIEGTADGIIEWHGRKLIELKSISDQGFMLRKSHHKPKDDHYRQAQIYMRCLDLDGGFVIYENKNNQEILPIFVERNDDFIDKLFKKYAKIYGMYKEGSLLKRPYKSIASQQCRMCDLAEMCWADEDNGV